MYSSPKLTILLVHLIVLINIQNAFSYTFFVETSEFNDDVYVIENVISNKENKSTVQIENTFKKSTINSISNKTLSVQNDRSDILSRKHEQQCTNLRTKPLLKLSKTFESNSHIKGINLQSLKNAESYWNIYEARDSFDDCNKLNKEQLLKTANNLKKIIKEENHYNLVRLFPKIYSFDKNTDSKLKNISQKSEDKYLEELHSEVLNLRNKLLNLTENNIIFEHYYNQIMDKSKYEKLSTDDKNFIANYNEFRINSKIESLGYDKNSFLKTGTHKANVNKIQIDEGFYNDISPMLDLFYLSEKPQYYQVKYNHNSNSSASIINQFAETLNNMP